jgi:hypothetical protein
MEGGVETGHLGQVRVRSAQRFDRREIVRQMKRGQREQRREVTQHLLRDEHRLRVGHPAVDHAVARRCQLTADVRFRPGYQMT